MSDWKNPVNEGFSILDFGDLPPDWRTVLRLVLRGNTMTDTQLWAAVEALPEDERMSQNELDEVLNTLCNRRWLMMNVDNQRTSYRVNLRRRTTHALAKHIWSALGMDQPGTPQTNVLPLRRGGNRKLPDNLWSVLDTASASAPPPKPERKNSVLATSLWDKALSDDAPADSNPADETKPHRPAPRKSVWDALTDDKPKDKPEN